MAISETTKLKKRVADLEAELEALRGRIADRTPLSLMLDWNGNVNVRRLRDSKPPPGYVLMNGPKVSEVLQATKCPSARCVFYKRSASGRWDDKPAGYLVPEELANTVAGYCTDLEAGLSWHDFHARLAAERRAKAGAA